jgi:hypothetical protein
MPCHYFGNIQHFSRHCSDGFHGVPRTFLFWINDMNPFYYMIPPSVLCVTWWCYTVHDYIVSVIYEWMNKWVRSNGGMITTGGYLSAQKKTSPSATFPTKDSKQIGLGSKGSLHNDRRATNLWARAQPKDAFTLESSTWKRLMRGFFLPFGTSTML